MGRHRTRVSSDTSSDTSESDYSSSVNDQFRRNEFNSNTFSTRLRPRNNRKNVMYKEIDSEIEDFDESEEEEPIEKVSYDKFPVAVFNTIEKFVARRVRTSKIENNSSKNGSIQEDSVDKNSKINDLTKNEDIVSERAIPTSSIPITLPKCKCMGVYVNNHPNDSSTTSYEYLVKYHKTSYLHCDWIDERDVLIAIANDRSLRTRFNNFCKRLDAGVEASETGLIDAVPERIVDCSDQFRALYPTKAAEIGRNEWMMYCLKIVDALVCFTRDHRTYGIPFLRAVDEEKDGAPGYYSVVKVPMDFTTIQIKLYLRKYESPQEFWSDVKLVFANCLLYNSPQIDISTQCRVLEALFDKLYFEWAKMSRENLTNSGDTNQNVNILDFEDTALPFVSLNDENLTTEKVIQHISFLQLAQNPNRQLLYLVKWKRRWYTELSWESADDITDKMKIAVYHRHVRVPDYNIDNRSSAYGETELQKRMLQETLLYCKAAKDYLLGNMAISVQSLPTLSTGQSLSAKQASRSWSYNAAGPFRTDSNRQSKVPSLFSQYNAYNTELKQQQQQQYQRNLLACQNMQFPPLQSVLMNSFNCNPEMFHNRLTGIPLHLSASLSFPGYINPSSHLQYSTTIPPHHVSNENYSKSIPYSSSYSRFPSPNLVVGNTLTRLIATQPVADTSSSSDRKQPTSKTLQNFQSVNTTTNSSSSRFQNSGNQNIILPSPNMNPSIQQLHNCGTPHNSTTESAQVNPPSFNIVNNLQNSQNTIEPLYNNQYNHPYLPFPQQTVVSNQYQGENLTTGTKQNLKEASDQHNFHGSNDVSLCEYFPEKKLNRFISSYIAWKNFMSKDSLKYCLSDSTINRIIPLNHVFSTQLCLNINMFSDTKDRSEGLTETSYEESDVAAEQITENIINDCNQIKEETKEKQVTFNIDEPESSKLSESVNSPKELANESEQSEMYNSSFLLKSSLNKPNVLDRSRPATFAAHSIYAEQFCQMKKPKPPPPGVSRHYPVSPAYKGNKKLFDYQLDGLNWLLDLWSSGNNGILADEMGLGKTIQSLALLWHLYTKEKMKGPFLVVAPLSTLDHWRMSAENWTDFNVVLYYDEGGRVGRDALRQVEWYHYMLESSNRRSKNEDNLPTGGAVNNPRLIPTYHYKFQLLLTSYEIFVSDAELLAPIAWQFVVVDEAHRLKNRLSKTLLLLKQVACRHILLLTGTPVQNNTEELWPLLNYIEPVRFCDVDAFKLEFGELQTSDQVKRLTDLLRPHLLRRVKEDVAESIPPLEETIIDVELTILQKAYYKAIYERNKNFLFKNAKKGQQLPSLMNVEMELRKCCNHPFMIHGVEAREYANCRSEAEKFKKLVESSGKLVLLDKLLPKLMLENHKVLIFSQFQHTLTLIQEFLQYKNWQFERLDGQVRGVERSSAISRFNDPSSVTFVFLLSTRAGGLGINLTSADTVIIFDSDWNPQNDIQATARAHRIGQEREVKVYRLVTARTYEADMFDRASKKLGLNTAVFHRGAFDSKARADKKKKDECGVEDSSISHSKTPSKDEIEELLKKGAFYLLENSTEASREFQENNIDEILSKNSRLVRYQMTGMNSTFAKTSFKSDKASDLSLDDPDFWQKVLNDSSSRRLLARLNDGSATASPEAMDAFMIDLQAAVESIAAEDDPEPVIEALVQLSNLTTFSAEHREQAEEWLARVNLSLDAIRDVPFAPSSLRSPVIPQEVDNENEDENTNLRRSTRMQRIDVNEEEKWQKTKSIHKENRKRSRLRRSVISSTNKYSETNLNNFTQNISTLTDKNLHEEFDSNSTHQKAIFADSVMDINISDFSTEIDEDDEDDDDSHRLTNRKKKGRNRKLLSQKKKRSSKLPKIDKQINTFSSMQEKSENLNEMSENSEHFASSNLRKYKKSRATKHAKSKSICSNDNITPNNFEIDTSISKKKKYKPNTEVTEEKTNSEIITPKKMLQEQNIPIVFTE